MICLLIHLASHPNCFEHSLVRRNASRTRSLHVGARDAGERRTAARTISRARELKTRAPSFKTRVVKRSSFAVIRLLPIPLALGSWLTSGCPNPSTGGSTGSTGTSTVNTVTLSTGPINPGSYCSKPGSVQFTGSGKTVIPGGVGADQISFVTHPAGFCAHYFATVPNARQLRFAPGGELFVASPTTGTTGGGPGGLAAIIVVPDDNAVAVGDTTITVFCNLA